jgi:class 3 adenylate cyclase/putative methionine-R-sulfoxide reductase with GAF domain
MKRRSSAGSKRPTPKRRAAPKVMRNRGVSVAGKETVVARLTHERDEALLRETANSEILRLISSSPGNLELVFNTILENATRICNANFGTLFRFDGENFYPMAQFNTPPALIETYMRRGPFKPTPGIPLDHVMRTKQTAYSADMTAEPVPALATKLGGARSLIAVPMLRDDALIGAILIYRQEVRPFTDKQIELVQNFAAEAVIAIENARLLSELRQRTTDLGESLEQQTATSDVLKIITSSQGELEPVFGAILENATRICEAKIGILFRFEDGAYTAFATLGVTPEYNEYLSRGPIRPGPGTGLGRIAAGEQTVHVIDTQTEQTYADREPLRVATAELGGARTLLNVPMLREGELIGAIGIYRQEVRPFTQKQVELVTNFAAQAVIAIENARLLNELRQRTEEVVRLNQQLEQRVADQVGEIERMGRLRRFLPPQVADLIVASGTEKQLESHRREITALFCDLRGFTGFSESSDPEDVMALLAEYHAAIGTIINKYSGTLERYAGDGVMVIFNDPVPVENPALQAVLMALDMRAAIGGLIEKWRDLGHDLGFGIGIAHGFATLGTIGFEGRRDYAAIGTVSNVASRLCDEAKPGQILISPRVRQAIEKAVTVEPVGEFALKGIRRPMVAYNVLESSPSKPN